MSSTKDFRRELGKKELFGIAIGQVIGAGIMALVGIGIAMTGRSVNLAFALSGVWVVLLSVPWIFISGCVRLRGGEYTQMAVLCGERFAGFYIFIFLLRNMQIPVYVLAFTNYWLGIFVGQNARFISIAVATLFFGLNVFPTKFIADVQNWMVAALCAALAAFIVYGMPEVQSGYFSEPGFMTHGAFGFISTSVFLTFATFGAASVFQLSGECKNPTKDIPFVLITATIGVAVLYGFVAMVAAGVLPLHQVEGMTLTTVAKAILPEPLYLFFIIGGALGAIATSLNATIAYVTKPLMQACEDGWFPRQFAYLHPRYKTPVRILAFYYVATITPILFGLDIAELTCMTLMLMYVCMIISSLATIRLPKLFPEQWEKSPFKCHFGLLVFFCVLAAIVLGFQVYFSIDLLSGKLLAVNAALMVVAIIYAFWRQASGEVRMTISHEDN